MREEKIVSKNKNKTYFGHAYIVTDEKSATVKLNKREYSMMSIVTNDDVTIDCGDFLYLNDVRVDVENGKPRLYPAIGMDMLEFDEEEKTLRGVKSRKLIDSGEIKLK